LLRMYDVTSGEIRIDQVPIKEFKLPNLRKQMSYVPQEVFLFSDTIANNISMGLEAGQAGSEQIRNAAKMAAIHEEIEQLPEAYQTVTGERGVMLSGGQKQRISIARALIKQPSILLLDESLSAVDTRTEHKIQSQLNAFLQHKTKLVITHRIFKGWNFDKTIVMQDGRITEQGTNNEVVRLKGCYDRLDAYKTLSDNEKK